MNSISRIQMGPNCLYLQPVFKHSSKSLTSWLLPFNNQKKVVQIYLSKRFKSICNCLLTIKKNYVQIDLSYYETPIIYILHKKNHFYLLRL